ncbi:5-methyltetrahydropteroyltriglutamate--homocysteine methyltransferase [Halobacteriales archaeon SW_6_65_46]|nr:MAG: 5-methyltetrahydropteroyltriglutamate--homocysteine methyltransferase [Halobacteriales archaeon SW_6_65_46]
MTELVATTPGLFPLPDWAKDRLSDLKGHQKSDLITGDETGPLAERYDEIRAELTELQLDAGLDRITEGQGRWDDMLAHPLTVHDSVETRGIVRYYDNNNFYREPVVTGELTPSGDVARELDAATAQTDSLQAVLPGPYTLAELATNEQYPDRSTFINAIAEFLAGEVAEFPAHETLFLLEPSLIEDAPEDDFDALASEAIDTVADATDAEVVVHPFYGALDETVYAHLMDADVDAIGFDLVTDHEQNVYNVQEYGTKESVALGVVDGQNTHVEEPEHVRERFDWFDAQIPAQEFSTAYLTSNTELFYLPVNKAEAKAETLATAADLEEVTQ